MLSSAVWFLLSFSLISPFLSSSFCVSRDCDYPWVFVCLFRMCSYGQTYVCVYPKDLERENAQYRPKFLNPTDSPRSRHSPTRSRDSPFRHFDDETAHSKLEVAMKVK